MRNPLLSKKLKRTETRLLIIDDNQIRYNQIRDLLTSNEYQVDAVLLDDLQSFEKQLNFNWDLIIFGRAYDLKYEQALSLV
ncbi:MAG: diguanylate phosphodiesterase, partial [Acinetobacter sp.]